MLNRRTCIKPVVCFLEMLCVVVMCFGQEEQDNRKVKSPTTYDDWFAKWVIFGGSGMTTPAPQAGNADKSDPQPLVNFGGAFEAGISLELGYIGPAGKLDSGSAFFSTGTTFPAMRLGFIPTMRERIKGTRFEMPLTLGYTRIIGTGNAVNFGAGLDVALSDYNGIRFEVRDYFKLSGRKEHNIVFRIAFLRHFNEC